MKRQLSGNLDNLLLSLSEVVDLANPSISQHQQRTAFIALEIAKRAKLAPETIENILPLHFCTILGNNSGRKNTSS